MQPETTSTVHSRGGPSLINSILDNAKVPHVIDGDGNCHVYVDEAADLDLATNVIVNAKCRDPRYAMQQNRLLHSQIAPNFLPRITNALEGVELVGDERSRRPGSLNTTSAGRLVHRIFD